MDYFWLPIVYEFRTLNWASIKAELQFSDILDFLIVPEVSL